MTCTLFPQIGINTTMRYDALFVKLGEISLWWLCCNYSYYYIISNTGTVNYGTITQPK